MPCMNGGSCFGSAYTYLCVCPVNFSGSLCERRLGIKIYFNNVSYYEFLLYLLGICQESPCGNRGLCVETGLTSFECRCYFDYMGPLCEEHVPKNDPSVWSCMYIHRNCMKIIKISCFFIICSTYTCSYTSSIRYITRSISYKSSR